MAQMTQPNPMLLPNIVSNVLCHLSDTTATLKKLRLVCQCWNQEACYILRQCDTIELTNIKHLQSYNTIFQQTYKMFGVFPHSKYRFVALPNDQVLKSPTNDATQSFLTQMVVIDEFLEYFGKYITCCHLPLRTGLFDASFLDHVLSKLCNITTLGLHIQYYHFQKSPIQFSPSAIQHLLHVKSLIICIDGLEMSEDMTYELLSTLFLYLTNLQKISYPGDIRRISKTGLLLRDSILELETSSNLSKLCEWNFKTRLLEEHSLKLLCKDFPLKALYVDLYNPEDDEQCVTSDIMAGLLLKWKESMNHLEIEFPFRKEISFHFHFPTVMDNLGVLYLGGFEGPILELLKKLPMLSKLDLSQLDLSVLSKPGESDAFLNVRQLRLDFCTGQTAGILSRFSRIFPLLQSLNINHATNEVVRVIFQKMIHLTTLEIHGNDLSDAGMCGFSEYSIKENDFLSYSPAQGNKFRKYAFIADLKALEYLNLDAYALTEITVRHGLVHCHSLRLVKMDCTAGGSCPTVSRKFRLSEYDNYLVEEKQGPLVEMMEEPPMEDEAIAFFQSHDTISRDLVELVQNFESQTLDTQEI